MPDSNPRPSPQKLDPTAGSITEESLEEKQRRGSSGSSVDSIAVLKELNKRPQNPVPQEHHESQSPQSPILANIYSAASLISSSVSSIIIQPISSAITAATAAQRSQQIDQQLEADFRSARLHQADILVFSGPGELNVKTVNAFRAYNVGYTEDELVVFKSDIRRYMVSVAKELVLIVREGQPKTDENILKNKVATLERQLEILDNRDAEDDEIEKALAEDPAFIQTLEELWQIPDMKILVGKNMTTPDIDRLDNPYEYFCTNLSRFSEPDYKPSIEDIHMLPHKKSKQHCRLYRSATLTSIPIPGVGSPEPETQLAVRLLLHRHNGEPRKWMHHIHDIDAVMAVSNLSLYNVQLLEDSSITWVTESIASFEGVAKSASYRSSALMVLFVGVKEFEEKIKSEPMKEAFPAYEGGSDPVKAMEFLTDKFRALVPEGRDVFFYFMDLGDEADAMRVISEIRRDMWKRKSSDI